MGPRIMISRCLLTAVAAGVISVSDGVADANLMQKYVGNSRPILIFAPDRYDRRLAQQMGRFSMHRREFRDRDVVVVEIGGPFMRADGQGVPHAPAMRELYGVSESEFTIILVGKDGGEKMRVSEVTDPQVFYALIDTMPMRRQELGLE